MPEAGRFDAGDVILPVEVGLHIVGTAEVPVHWLHRLVDAPPIDRGRQYSHGPLLFLGTSAKRISQHVGDLSTVDHLSCPALPCPGPTLHGQSHCLHPCVRLLPSRHWALHADTRATPGRAYILLPPSNVPGKASEALGAWYPPTADPGPAPTLLPPDPPA